MHTRRHRREACVLRFLNHPHHCYRISMAKALRDVRRHFNQLHHIDV